ncbi:MAG: ATPase V, partial [Nitrosopumilus sp.]
MTGIEQKINELNKKYQSTKRDRRNLENQLQVAIKTSDRTSSNLKNIDKKIELENETAVDYSAILNQKNSQIESITRLIENAKNRIENEENSLEQAKQDVEYADTPEERVSAETRVRLIENQISELNNEIKSREKTHQRISKEIDDITGKKVIVDKQLKKQSKTKSNIRSTFCLLYTSPSPRDS